MFAIALSIASVRVVGVPIAFLLIMRYGVSLSDMFALSVWAGWLLTVGGAECWIRYTRPRMTPVLRVPAVTSTGTAEVQ